MFLGEFKIPGHIQIIQLVFGCVNIFFISYLNIFASKRYKIAFKDNSGSAMSHIGISAVQREAKTWSGQDQWN